MEARCKAEPAIGTFIARLDEARLVDGPCLVVDRILALSQSRSIDELVERFDLSIENWGTGSPLHVAVERERHQRNRCADRLAPHTD